MTAALDSDALVAAADLVGRSGASNFQVGYLHDDDDPSFLVFGPQWYAHAQYRGRRITAEGFDRPDDAADHLAKKILAGGQCAHCALIVSLDFDAPERCHWWREADRWVRGCEGMAR